VRPALFARGRKRSERAAGQGLVEFALVVPIIVILAVACVDLGRAVLAYNTLETAARDAVRVASLSQLDPVAAPYRCESNHPVDDPADPAWTFRGCALAAGAPIGLGPGEVTVAYAAPEGTALECRSTINVGCIASVTVTHDFEPVTPIVGAIIGRMTMDSTATSAVERVYP
jgi:Flp pilus assembly protein TadG